MAKVLVLFAFRRIFGGTQGVVYIDHVTDEDKQVIAPELKLLGTRISGVINQNLRGH